MPDAVLIAGRAYPIRTDFRAGVAYQIASMEKSLTPAKLLAIWFPEAVPTDIQAAQKAVNAFYRRSEEEPGEGKDAPVAYAFGADGGAILAAFQRSYGIDLTTASMHWWRFCALLEGLLTHTFEQRVQFRLAEPGKIKNKEARSHALQMKRLYALNTAGKPLHESEPQTVEGYYQWMLQKNLARREDGNGGKV